MRLRLRSLETTVLDVGSSHVACATFKLDRSNRIALQRLVIEELSIDSGAIDNWTDEIERAFGRISAGAPWANDVRLSLPAHVALTRFTKIPALSTAKLSRVVDFEAAQTIPYPLADVSWTSLLLDSMPARQERDIMFAAARTDAMVSLCDGLKKSRFDVRSAVPSCLALREGFRQSHPGVTDPALLIDIGARSTQLLFLYGEKFFTRALPFGSNSITHRLAEELRLEFTAAETLKVQLLASTGTVLVNALPWRALNVGGEQFRAKLTTEIARALVHIERQMPEMVPRVVYLAGAGSLLEGVDIHISDTLKLAVKRCEPLVGLTVAESVGLIGDVTAARLLPLVGLASHAFADRERGVDLLPALIRKRIDRRRQRPFFMGAAALMVIAFLPPTFHFWDLAKRSRSEMTDLEARVVPLRQLKQRQADLELRLQEARTLLRALQNVATKRTTWIAFLADLQDRLTIVQDVWLESLLILPDETEAKSLGAGSEHPKSKLKIEVSGRLLDRSNPVAKVSAESYDRVKQLIASFNQSPFVAAVEGEHFDNAQPGILKFAVTLLIQPDNTL